MPQRWPAEDLLSTVAAEDYQGPGQQGLLLWAVKVGQRKGTSTGGAGRPLLPVEQACAGGGGLGFLLVAFFTLVNMGPQSSLSLGGRDSVSQALAGLLCHGC